MTLRKHWVKFGFRQQRFFSDLFCFPEITICSFPVFLFSSLLPLAPHFSKILLPLPLSTLAAPPPLMECHLGSLLRWTRLEGRRKRASFQLPNLLSLVFVFRDLTLKTSGLVYLDTHTGVFFTSGQSCCLAAAFPELQSQEAWHF